MKTLVGLWKKIYFCPKNPTLSIRWILAGFGCCLSWDTLTVFDKTTFFQQIRLSQTVELRKFLTNLILVISSLKPVGNFSWLHYMLAKILTNASGILFCWRDNSSYKCRRYILGPLCCAFGNVFKTVQIEKCFPNCPSCKHM